MPIGRRKGVYSDTRSEILLATVLKGLLQCEGNAEIANEVEDVIVGCVTQTQEQGNNINPRGGAIALGHPTGASGARLMTTLLHELEDKDKEFGLPSDVLWWGYGNCNNYSKSFIYSWSVLIAAAFVGLGYGNFTYRLKQFV